MKGGTQKGGTMLDNGKAQACTADFLRMTLIHTVKALEDPALVFRRDADTGIRYCKKETAVLFFGGQGNRPPGPVVFDGVVAQIVQNFMKDGLYGPHGQVLPLDR